MYGPKLPPSLSARTPELSDHARMIEVFPEWWAGSRGAADARRLSDLLEPLFIEHFGDSCLIVEKDGELVAFLVAFLSQRRTDAGYIHFIGVHPDYRGDGLARALYEWFFAFCAEHGRTVVGAITGQGNHGSIAFHRGMGFSVDTNGTMVHFCKKLET